MSFWLTFLTRYHFPWVRGVSWNADYQSRDPNNELWLVDYLIRSVHWWGEFSSRSVCCIPVPVFFPQPFTLKTQFVYRSSVWCSRMKISDGKDYEITESGVLTTGQACLPWSLEFCVRTTARGLVDHRWFSVVGPVLDCSSNFLKLFYFRCRFFFKHTVWMLIHSSVKLWDGLVHKLQL